MKAFITACVIAAVLATGAAFVLDHYQKTASVAFSTTGARI